MRELRKGNNVSEEIFKFYVLKGIYLIMRHLTYIPMNSKDMLDYRKEIKDAAGIDIYGNFK